MTDEAKKNVLARLILLIFAIAVLIMLQMNYWHGEYGRLALKELNEDLTRQETQNRLQQQRNAILAADVKDLKSGLTATEEHARLDLGLIKPNETFVQLSTASVAVSSLPKGVDDGEAVEMVDPVLEILPSPDATSPSSSADTRPDQ